MTAPARRQRPVFLTVLEVAAALRVSKMTIYREIHEGRIKAVRVGHGMRIASTEMDRYVTERATDWNPS